MPAAQWKSKNFDGVKQIFLYNWHFYAAALFLDVLAALVLARFPPQAGIRLGIYLVVGLSTFWALSSLLVSHYVYDRSCLSQWNWLAKVVKSSPGSWVNIHAGLDQTSESLTRLFSRSPRRILDIYTSSEMTESSIERARRRARPNAAAEKASPAALPLKNSECDVVFLIFAAHELRQRQARVQLFLEIRRALQPGGSVVLVEHLRDWKNLLAYGPGALHFFSAGEWLSTCDQAGFHTHTQLGITPFVRCFVFTVPMTPEASHQAEEAQCD